jgi:hypothetical protein
VALAPTLELALAQWYCCYYCTGSGGAMPESPYVCCANAVKVRHRAITLPPSPDRRFDNIMDSRSVWILLMDIHGSSSIINTGAEKKCLMSQMLTVL